MKTGLTTSVIMHAALLGFGLFSLSAPKAFDVADVEALPVDIVPIESMTQIQQGDKKAPLSEKPAPLPTKKPDVVPDAQKVGENKVDTNTPPTPEPTPKEIKTAAIPKLSPEPAPKPADKPEPEPVKQAEPKPTPVPATEVTPKPQPKQEVKPDPVAETIVAENAEAEATKLPENAPSPDARPQPPKAETAKTPERKEADEQPAQKQASRPKSEEKEFDADEVAALLNKEKPSGGGAKRSTEQAALGGNKTNNGSKLSQSEMDALRGQVQRCWNIPAGAVDAENLRVSVKFKLDPSGALEGSPEIISGGGSSGVERAAAEAARRAVSRCAPYNLPADKYEAWADVIVNFDPSEMF
jgi:outer membrane biosynthesis protein TonB